MIVAMSSSGKIMAWLIPFGLLVGAILIVPLRILDRQGLPRYRALSEELVQVRKSNDQARRSLRRLEITVRALRSNPEAVERIARDELGMLFKDELLFQFPSDNSTDDQSGRNLGH
jgi:cell division protein FtsB